MLLVKSLCLVASLLGACLAQESAPKTSVEEPILDAMRSTTIYDSVSPSTPYELRERGIAYYNPSNASGTFSDSGILSRPLDSVKDVYRIGTEDFLVASRLLPEILTHSGALDETLTLHLDLTGTVFHAQYDVKPAKADPGSFNVKIDPASAHMGPEVKLQTRVVKTRVSPDGQGAVLEEEEEVPEKTFIQKYWIYAVPLVLLLVLGGGSEN